jgi:hypothetical protein
VHKIPNLISKSYGLAKFIEIDNSYPVPVKRLEKIPNRFKGSNFFFAKLVLFLLIDSIFCCFEHLFESQDDSF